METLLFLFYLCFNLSLYPKTMIVTEINTTEDYVVCEDYTGNLWSFDGVEDWQEGDICSAIMWGKGTAEVIDDEIVMARYNGNVNAKEGN